MTRPTRSLRSSIGRKMVVALTGLALLGFVVAHMLGNLQVFLGPDALNAYAAGMQGLGPVLWLLRGGLAAVLVVHVALAAKLALENREARPVRYANASHRSATLGARSMVLTGCMVLLFVLYHLAHFTLGITDPAAFALTEQVAGPEGPIVRHDVYSMVVLGFRQPLVSGLYVAAMALLALHLSHGVQSIFQSLGLNGERLERPVRRIGQAVAAVIFLGNTSIPVAILAGAVGLPGAQG